MMGESNYEPDLTPAPEIDIEKLPDNIHRSTGSEPVQTQRLTISSNPENVCGCKTYLADWGRGKGEREMWIAADLCDTWMAFAYFYSLYLFGWKCRGAEYLRFCKDWLNVWHGM